MARPIRILELRSVRGTGGGPEKTILLGAAQSDPDRFAVTVCYLRDRRDTVFAVDAMARVADIEYREVLERRSFDWTIWPTLRDLVRERGIDIVHSHEYKTDLLALLLARFERVIPLATVHGWTGHSRRERLLYYPADKRALRLFPKVIAVSGDIRRELVRSGTRPDRIVTILNGIDPAAFRREGSRQAHVRRRLGLGDNEIVIGTVGRLEPQKRFDLLIEAVAALRASRPGIVLLIAGDGGLRKELASQIARLGLGTSCRLLGQRADVVDLHHAFDVFVQSSDYEGTPNAVLEAMALETPVVATDVGGTRELVRSGVDGVIVPAGSTDALARAIEDVLVDPGRARSMAAAARQRVETDLSFAARMAAVEAVYSNLVERRWPREAAPVPART